MKTDSHKCKKIKVVQLAHYVARMLVLARWVLTNLGYSAKTVADGLASLSALRDEVERPVEHITISPHLNDKISPVVWKEIALVIVAKLELPEGWPIAIARHELRQRRHEPHLHILLPHIGDNGAKLPNPPSPYRISQIAAQIETEFGLAKTSGFLKKNARNTNSFLITTRASGFVKTVRTKATEIAQLFTQPQCVPWKGVLDQLRRFSRASKHKALKLFVTRRMAKLAASVSSIKRCALRAASWPPFLPCQN